MTNSFEELSDADLMAVVGGTNNSSKPSDLVAAVFSPVNSTENTAVDVQKTLFGDLQKDAPAYNLVKNTVG